MTSRLEFFREPSWMKQWPFAHTIEMTYRLRNGVLEVATSISNQSSEQVLRIGSVACAIPSANREVRLRCAAP